MITTLDGKTKKRGEKVYKIAVTMDGTYHPMWSIVHGGFRGVTNKDKCWESRDLCQTECDSLNKR